MHPHLAGNMGQDLVTIFQFDSESGIGKRFADNTVNFYGWLFGRTNLPGLPQLSARRKNLSFPILDEDRMFKMRRRRTVA